MTKKAILAICLCLVAWPLIHGCAKKEPETTSGPTVGQPGGRRAKVNPETGDRG